MARIVLESVRKSYGAIEVIKGISIDIADGELVVLVGPSGCGKSTLLRMIAGLEAITEGTVSIGKRIVNDLEPAERDIAMVFQNYALYPHMTVRRNLEYGLKIRGTPKDEIKMRVDEAAHILEIGPFLDRKPRQLSGGQRQRVAMGRAIVRKPAAFLFDEPLSNLDAKLRGQMRIEIRRLQRALATTSIYVTHDQLEAMTLADRLVVMNAGKVEQIGSPLDLYEKPETAFVATFIGAPAMNLLPVQTQAGRLVLEGGGLSSPASLGAGTAFTLGLRPEDLVIAKEAVSADALSVDLTVSAVEPVGAETYVYGTLMGSGRPIAVRAPGRMMIEPGTALKAAAPLSALHAFDQESGRRIA